MGKGISPKTIILFFQASLLSERFAVPVEERELTTYQLIQHHSQTVDVSHLIIAFTLQYLRCEVD